MHKKVSFIIGVLDSVLSFTYIYSRNLFIWATFLSRMFCDEPFFLLESIWRAIKFKPQRQNMMNAAAVPLIWHFPTVLVPLLLHMFPQGGYFPLLGTGFFYSLPDSHKWCFLLHVRRWLGVTHIGHFPTCPCAYENRIYNGWLCRDIEKVRKALNCVYIIKDSASGLGAWLYLFGFSSPNKYLDNDSSTERRISFVQKETNAFQGHTDSIFSITIQWTDNY